MKKFVITLFSLITISATAAINPNTRPKSSGTYYSEQYRILDNRNYYTTNDTFLSNGLVVSLNDNQPITGSLVEYGYNNGIQSIKNYKNGVLDGKVYYLNGDGGVSTVSEYKNGQKNGEEINFSFSTGYSSIISSYKNGVLDGPRYEFDDKGSLISASEYSNGVKEGNEIKFSEGRKIQEDIYKNGRKNGKSVSYYTDGSVKSEGIYRDNLRDKEWSWYFSAAEGKNVKRLTEVYDYGKLKQIRGQYPDGSKERKADLVNGNGDFEQYYNNGAIKLKGKIKNYAADGTWIVYDLRGVPVARNSFNVGGFQY